MYRNRLDVYLPISRFSLQGNPESHKQLDGEWNRNSQLSFQDILQSAYAKARQDYELNRLFNPQYYEDGDGI